MNNICFVCKCTRPKEDIYFKHRTNMMCRHCLVNGLTYEARFMFEEDSVEAETYKVKVGMISPRPILNEDDWNERFAD